MTDWFFATLRQYPEIAIFLTLAIGYFFGKFTFKGIGLGPVIATLLAGVLIGQIGITIGQPLKATVFLMFLFAVGYARLGYRRFKASGALCEAFRSPRRRSSASRSRPPLLGRTCPCPRRHPLRPKRLNPGSSLLQTQRRRSPGSSLRGAPWPWVQRDFASAATSESLESIAPPTAGAAQAPASRRFRTRTRSKAM